uniref:Protein kinase domain-containing protein n=1 Tax=Globisporangium ultimum (strain ATCC 200006 / CBS 805.95 / DAOM BR144) TaxID=431595 RepID=K3XCI4_GLOUD
MLTQIQGITDRLVVLVNLKPPVVPEWFVSSDDVDFQERNMVGTYHKKKYHGTWKKANVMVALSDLRQRDFEVRATKWFSLRHPNIVALYGACHIVNPPFFVYEFDPNEINLLEFLNVEANRHLVWEKLYEVALGIHYLHQRQVAYGELGIERIVISRNGQAKVGGLEENNSYYQRPPEQLRSEMIASPASDIFSFGIFIMDTTTDVIKAIDAANMFQHGEIPERAPNLSGEQWNLVVKMCAYEPQGRVDIAYVVNQLKIFAMECGNTSQASDYEANAGSTE